MIFEGRAWPLLIGLGHPHQSTIYGESSGWNEKPFLVFQPKVIGRFHEPRSASIKRQSSSVALACLRVQSSKLYHLGFRSAIARNTLANANAVRDWRIYADFAQHLIGIARRLYADNPLSLDLATLSMR
jgi:hypothetical protein